MLHTLARRLRHALTGFVCLGMLGFGAAPGYAADVFTPTSAFTDNGDGTVTHQLTGLTWMRCAMGQTWTGATCSGTASYYKFDQAMALTSSFAGKSDWRLPSSWELVSIVDYDIADPGPTINATIFPNAQSLYFWSGSAHAHVSEYAWSVNFSSGSVDGGYRIGYASVRLVRGGQSFGTLSTPTADFIDHGDGSVTHSKTSLTWKRCAEGQSWSGTTCSGSARMHYYDQALTLSASFAGKSDWRLPSVSELQSIVEYGAFAPAINSTIFPNTPSSYFWSGSPHAYNSSYAWIVSFSAGFAYGKSRSYGNSVRLVRGVQSSGVLPASIIPTALSLTTPATLQSSGRTQLVISASYSDNSSKAVSPVWSSSDPAVASVSSSGLLSAGSVSVDTPVTLTASYTENGATVSTSKTVTITSAPATLATLALAGGSVVSSGGLLRFTASAGYSDGSSRGVVVSSWSVSPSSLGSINSRGELTVGNVSVDTPLTVSASYTEGSTTQTASKAITIKNITATYSTLSIVGAQGTLGAGESLNLVAESGYSDASSKRVSASWSISNSTAATIDSNGMLTAGTVTVDTPVLVTASYTEAGKTLTANYHVIVQPSAVAPQFTVEVIATLNAQNLTKLQLWFNTEALAAVGGKRYKLYVAALLPAGPLRSQPTFFLLNRNREWQALSWPLAEHRSGVNASEWQLIELFEASGTSGIAGAQIFVGYGESDTEMFNAGRYSMVYQMP